MPSGRDADGSAARRAIVLVDIRRVSFSSVCGCTGDPWIRLAVRDDTVARTRC
jgi:hypothetical protein